MYYFVSIEVNTDFKGTKARQLNHIRANNRVEAKKKVNEYNQRHPSWKMKLLKRNPTNSQNKLATKLMANRMDKRNRGK